MPELPEVESVRRTIEPRVLGRRVARVVLRRAGVLEVGPGHRRDPAGLERAMLAGGVISAVERHGKNLALVADDGRALGVHLGMSGSLCWYPSPPRRLGRHAHGRWWLEGGADDVGGLMVFDDPRRFGGLEGAPSLSALRERCWARLGPDAWLAPMEEMEGALARACAKTIRAVKAVLLDQGVVAGVGNIYADEALFEAGVDPRTMGCAVPDVGRLAMAVREVLGRAIAARGTTLRDYRDADGQRGEGGVGLRAYGRGGMPCVRCGAVLERFVLGGRTTSACPGCQPWRGSRDAGEGRAEGPAAGGKDLGRGGLEA